MIIKLLHAAMAGVKSFGRGRGRGWAQPNDDPLPKPGRLLDADWEESTDHDDFSKIVDRVNDENLQQQAKQLSQLIDKTRNQDLNQDMDVIQKLYKRAVHDRVFAMKLMKLCDLRTIYKMNTFYKDLINCFQKDYERRDELRQDDPAEFYRVVSLFFTYASKKLFSDRVLKLGMIGYMKVLLETHAIEDVRLFTEMFVKYGGQLTEIKICIKDFNELMITCREILIKENVPNSSRLKLMYAIDLEQRGFAKLPDYLKTFYKAQLGEEYTQP